MSRPKRACTTRTAQKIQAVYNWENCSELSSQFVSAAADMDADFEQEEADSGLSETYIESSGEEEEEAEDSDEDSYESSFVSKSDADESDHQESELEEEGVDYQPSAKRALIFHSPEANKIDSPRFGGQETGTPKTPDSQYPEPGTPLSPNSMFAEPDPDCGTFFLEDPPPLWIPSTSASPGTPWTPGSYGPDLKRRRLGTSPPALERGTGWSDIGQYNSPPRIQDPET